MSRSAQLAPKVHKTWFSLWIFSAAAMCSAALFGGCGADTALTGVAAYTDGSSISGADGSLSGQQDGGSSGLAEVTIVDPDGAPVQQDGVAVQDGTVVGPGDSGPTLPPDLSCAGKCGQAKPNQWACQCDSQCSKYGDCCGDYAQLCGTVGPGPNPSDLIACLSKSCTAEIANCQSQKVCGAFWTCAQNCKDQKCIENCTVGLDVNVLGQQSQDLMKCGQDAGCIGGTGPGPGPSGPVCGNGKCEQPENSLNCAKDCPNTPPGKTQVCLSEKCPDSYKACFGDQACIAAVACMNNGGSPQQCSGGNPATGKLLMTMLQCGQQQGCIGGGGPQPVCGNGACESGETPQNCPKDCQVVVPPTDPITKCLAVNCTDSYNKCSVSQPCVEAAKCLQSGGGMMQCVKDMATGQLVLALVNCGNKYNCFDATPPQPASCAGKCGSYTPGASCQCDAKCVGNGNCCGDYKTACGGTTSPDSCKGKCGQYDVNAKCQCNVSCAQFGNCCTDYTQVCGTPPPPPTKCGDGVCTAPETATTCPADCAVTPTKPCKTKADCSGAEICCGLADGTQICTTKCQ